MTEAEWLEGRDPDRMLVALRGETSERKLRLLVCGTCRRWGLDGKEEWRRVLELAEAAADDEIKLTELFAWRSRADNSRFPTGLLWSGSTDIRSVVFDEMYGRRMPRDEAKRERQIIRDVFGNPFRPPSLDPAWLTRGNGTVAELAGAIYDDRVFDRLPVLADALEEAGCADEKILRHCREPGEHVRGCWVVDLLLGKQ